MSARGALLTASLEAELEAQEGDGILLRVERPSEVSRGSLHGMKEDVGRTIRLTAQPGLNETGLPEFSITPSQESVSAIFVPLARLQRDLEQAEPSQYTPAPGAIARRSRCRSAGICLSGGSLPSRALPSNAGELSVESAGLMLSPPIVEAVEAAASELSLRTDSVFTYLANTLRVGDRETPYSLVAAVAPDRYPGGMAPDGIVLNDWAGNDLGARPGDRLTMEFYVWEDEGRIETREASFTVEGIVPMTGIAGDRDLAPIYPGISETDDLSDWEPPFPVDLRRVRDKDEDYWDRFRTTPKAFLPLARGQEIWPVRQGNVTSIRVAPPDEKAAFERALREKLDPLALGFTVVAVREEGLRAASGATDFGQYFVYFSWFLVAAAALLSGLFFKLGVEQRHREIGTLLATGFTPARVRRLFLAEGLMLSVVGALLGTLLALGYAALILHGLRTWWVDAVGTRLLTLHVSSLSLAIGLAGGILAALFATWLTLRYLARVPARSLLAGDVAPTGERVAKSLSARGLALGRKSPRECSLARRRPSRLSWAKRWASLDRAHSFSPLSLAFNGSGSAAAAEEASSAPGPQHSRGSAFETRPPGQEEASSPSLSSRSRPSPSWRSKRFGRIRPLSTHSIEPREAGVMLSRPSRFFRSIGIPTRKRAEARRICRTPPIPSSST